MNDMDFDEMGKRLYDMEADPPKDGWDKLYGGLHNQPRGKGVFFRKHWWKPLVLLIPMLTYYVVSDSGLSRKGQQVADHAAANTPMKEVKPETKMNEKNPSPGTAGTGTNSTPKTRTMETDVVLNGKNSEEPNSLTAAGETTKVAKSMGVTDENLASRSASGKTTPGTTVKSSGTKKDNPASTNDEAILPLAVDQPASDSNTRPNETNTGITVTTTGVVIEKDATSEIPAANQKESLRSSYSHPESESQTKTNVADSRAGVTRPANGAEPAIALIAGGNNGTTGVETESVRELTSATEESTVTRQSAFAGPPRAASSASAETNAQDSLASLQVKTVVVTDSAISVKSAEKSYDQLPWRATFSITPQYMTKTVKPLPNDEVLMFATDAKSFYREHIGVAAGIGIGKAITQDFYLDAQLSFQKSSQSISYSYSNGKVDTLMATRLADGTILVSPVYELNTTEISADYTYSGLRLTATYYFWATPRGRFNLTAGGGINYLISSDIREKSNGQWVTVTDDYLNKTNYSLSISGGYNIKLGQGWELLINPILTYYPARERIRDLPFDFHQKSYGLNLMLSKNLSFKK